MPNSRIRSNPLALVILTLLAEAPMHPYEMQVKMRERGHERVVRIKAASIYDTVERLSGQGLVEALETSREGRRPERTVYRITEKGHEEMLAWLRALIEEPAADYRSFEAGLTFLVALVDRDLAIDLLRRRAVALTGEIASSDARLTAIQEVPRVFLIEEEYAQALRRAERDWVQGLVTELQSGHLEWPDFPAWEERREL